MTCAIEDCPREAHCRGLCNRHYQRLRRFGDARAPARDQDYWTPAELSRLEALLETGATDEEIARAVGRSAGAIESVRCKRGIAPRSAALLNATDVGRALGMPYQPVARWLAKGWLKGRRHAGSHWLIREEAFLRFLETPRYWSLWEPSRIPDPALREWGRELRAADEPHLDCGEVARLLCYERRTVTDWVRFGLLPARPGPGFRWMVPRSALDAFTPPAEKSFAGISMRRFRPDEDERLLTLQAQGVTMAHIARVLGRPRGSLHGRLGRLRAKAAAL